MEHLNASAESEGNEEDNGGEEEKEAERDPSDHLRHQERIREIILTANNRFE